MDRAIYKQKIIDIVTEMKSRLTDPNNTATEDFAEGFTVALETAGIISVSFVEELPDEGVENVLYVDKVLLRFAIWQDNDWDFFPSGEGLSFSDLVAILQDGTNVTLDVDTVAETITINASDWTQIQSDWNQTNNTQVDYIKNKPTEFPASAHTHSDTEVSLTGEYTGNLVGATTQKDANDILDALVGGGDGKEWQLQFFNLRDSIQVEATPENIATFGSGLGINIGTIEVSNDGVTYTPLIFPFSPTVDTWYFKRSSSLATGVYILDALVDGGKEWQLQFFNQAYIIQVGFTPENIASFGSGVGTDVGTIEVSDDGVTYYPLVFPFYPSVGTWYFKRSINLVTGIYIISE